MIENKQKEVPRFFYIYTKGAFGANFPQALFKTDAQWDISEQKIMKKILFLSLMFVAFAATSCKITDVTASYQDPKSVLNTATVADLDVSNERISFTFKPSVQVRRGGNANVIRTAIREALRVNGGGDLLVDLEYITRSTAPLFSRLFLLSPIGEVTVSGYPAKYKNFHNLGDSIWAPTKLYPEHIEVHKSTNQSINQTNLIH